LEVSKSNRISYCEEVYGLNGARMRKAKRTRAPRTCHSRSPCPQGMWAGRPKYNQGTRDSRGHWVLTSFFVSREVCCVVRWLCGDLSFIERGRAIASSLHFFDFLEDFVDMVDVFFTTSTPSPRTRIWDAEGDVLEEEFEPRLLLLCPRKG
jgi:hypothetical protein